MSKKFFALFLGNLLSTLKRQEYDLTDLVSGVRTMLPVEGVEPYLGESVLFENVVVVLIHCMY